MLAVYVTCLYDLPLQRGKPGAARTVLAAFHAAAPRNEGCVVWHRSDLAIGIGGLVRPVAEMAGGRASLPSLLRPRCICRTL